MAKDKNQRAGDDGPDVPEWIVTFSDMISLLVTFFVLLMTFSSLEEDDVIKVKGAMTGTPGVILDDLSRDMVKAPLDLMAKLLIDSWKLGDEEAELTVMRVTVRGKKNGHEETITYELHDVYDPSTKTSSMARTTGYTATAAANWFLEGNIYLSPAGDHILSTKLFVCI